jgi:hypothetical protein
MELVIKVVWEELHSKPFEEVSLAWRALFACCSVLKAEKKLKFGNQCGAMRDCDVGLLLGGNHVPLRMLLHELVAQIKEQMPQYSPPLGRSALPVDSFTVQSKEVKTSVDLITEIPVDSTLAEFATHFDNREPIVIRQACQAAGWPALTTRPWFRGDGQPDPFSYLREVAGTRTVPVEVGRHHLDSGGQLQQRLMTLNDFIDELICCCTPCTLHQLDAPVAVSAVVPVTAAKTKGYLAQHQIFRQIPALQSDIVTPACTAIKFIRRGAGAKEKQDVAKKGAGTSGQEKEVGGKESGIDHNATQEKEGGKESEKKDGELDNRGRPVASVVSKAGNQISLQGTVTSNRFDSSAQLKFITSAWFGPKGSVTPLHFDHHDNILAQVFGQKLVLLCTPSTAAAVGPDGGTGGTSSSCFYPGAAEGVGNASEVDAEAPDFDKFPLFKHVRVQRVVLGPGDQLFIPEGVWHYVRTLSTGFAVSFWF